MKDPKDKIPSGPPSVDIQTTETGENIITI